MSNQTAGEAASGVNRSLVDDLKLTLACSVCIDFIMPPILQCVHGHLFCETCYEQLKVCPCCMADFGTRIRNLALESLAEKIEFPCKHQDCDASLKSSEKKKHEQVCDFREYGCPLENNACVWLGRIDSVMKHISDVHADLDVLVGEHVQFKVKDVMSPNMPQWIKMQKTGGRHFLLMLIKSFGHNGLVNFHAIARLIGTIDEASKFQCTFELRSGRFVMSWNSKPLSLQHNFSTALETCEGMVMDSNNLMTFLENGNLQMNVTMKLVR